MRKLVPLLLLLVLGLLTAGVGEAAAKIAPESREYKILLRAGNFASFQRGCEQFWKIVERVAEEHSLKVKKAIKPFPDREICFLDTADFALYRHGFMLRLRTEDITTLAGNRLAMGADAEMTLKFRAADVESVQVAPITPAVGHTSELSCEEDVVIKATEPVSVFSASAVIMRPAFVPSTLDELLRFYPEMKTAGFTGLVSLLPVHNRFVTEKRLRLGEITFQGKPTKTIFSVWIRTGEGKPLVAEFSFKIGLKAKNKADRLRRGKIDRFFVDLVRQGKPLVLFGQTKTELIYQSSEVRGKP